MKNTIQEFLDDKKVAVVGASPNKDNFGRSLVAELSGKGYSVIPVNPKYEQVEGISCVPTVRDLPGDVTGVILAVPPDMTGEIVDQCIGTPVRRVWMIQGVGRGAYSEDAHAKCRENGIRVVHGFCPMMFYGSGFHHFHLWLRKNFGKLPHGYREAED
jgi:predicted CoA-binding protein